MAIALSLIAGAIVNRNLWLNFVHFIFVLGALVNQGMKIKFISLIHISQKLMANS